VRAKGEKAFLGWKGGEKEIFGCRGDREKKEFFFAVKKGEKTEGCRGKGRGDGLESPKMQSFLL